MEARLRKWLIPAHLLGVVLLTAAFLSAFWGVAGSGALSDALEDSAYSGPRVESVQGYINPAFLKTHTTEPFDSTDGDLIVVCASSHAEAIMTPSDSFHNSWIPLVGPQNTTIGSNLRTQLWYAKDPAVGPGHTFTMHLSTPMSLVVSLYVVNGSDASSPIDAISPIGDDAGSQSLRVISPSVTTSSPNELLLGFAKSALAERWHAGKGFTAQPEASSNFLVTESRLALTPGSYRSTFDFRWAGTWQAVVVSVRGPAAGSARSASPQEPTER